MMNIVERLTPINHSKGRDGQAVRSVVLHITDGKATAANPDGGAVSWFHSPASEVSAHYVAGIDGTITRVVAEADTAWGNGKLNRPDLSNPLIDSWVRAGLNPNSVTVSIEIAGKPGPTKPPVQWAAVVALVADICRRHGLTRDRTRVIGHFQLDSVTRARCPSLTTAQWEELTMPDEQDQYAIGAGIRAAMDRAGDEPRSHENFIKTTEGKDICSIAFGSSGAYIYSPATDSVYRVQKA